MRLLPDPFFQFVKIPDEKEKIIQWRKQAKDAGKKKKILKEFDQSKFHADGEKGCKNRKIWLERGCRQRKPGDRLVWNRDTQLDQLIFELPGISEMNGCKTKFFGG
jgi:hypothetical protein